MAAFDRREVSYTQARNELLQTLRDEFVNDLPEHDRGERVRHLVRDIAHRYPDLDEHLTRRLMGEALRDTGTWGDPV